MFAWEKCLNFTSLAFHSERNSSTYSYFHLLIDSSQGKWMQQGDYESKAGFQAKGGFLLLLLLLLFSFKALGRKIKY